MLARAGARVNARASALLIDPGADEHLLLVRRSLSNPNELACYICHSSQPVPLAELVRVAGSGRGSRKRQFTKNETGLDQVRKYDAWYRHITLSMLAAAFSPSPPTPKL